MENEVIEQKRSYITGIIGAIIGGLIATIPWVLVYVYGNMMLSLLAVIIAAGEFYGYKLFKGKIDNKLPAIIMVLAIIIVTIVTLLIIPAMLLGKENMQVSFDTIKLLYSYNDFAGALFKDYVISVVFTVLGASVITSNIKKQLQKEEGDIKLDLSNKEEIMKQKQEAINLLKPIFERYNATNKETTMTKEEVLAEVEDKNAKVQFNYLANFGIIKKVKGRFYYCEENEKNIKANSSTGKICAIIIALGVIVIGISLIFGDNTTKIQPNGNDDVGFSISQDWEVLNEYNEESGWTYYKYINNLGTALENVQSSDGTIDYTKYPARIGVAYDTEPLEEGYNSIDELKTTLEEYIKEELVPEEYNMETITTEKGYSAIKAKIKYTSYPEEIDYLYYIYKDGKLGYITATTFNMDDDKELETASMKILNSFEWKN